MWTLLLLSACDPGGVAARVAQLEAPTEVRLEGAVVRQTNLLSVVVSNRGTRDAALVIEVDAPFVWSGGYRVVRAEASESITVGVTPADYQPLTGTLIIKGPDGPIEVALSATVTTDADADGVDASDAGGRDCDDQDPRVAGGFVEVCDGRDNNCSGTIDDVDDPPAWYPDLDGDGYGADVPPTLACEAPRDHVRSHNDCDDRAYEVNPGAQERYYDGVDQNCDGASDFDADQDGYDAGADCLDSDPTINPGRAELDDGVDQDCDGWVDEGFFHSGELVWTELMLTPAQVGTDQAYLELRNSGARDLQLDGLEIEIDGVRSSLELGLVLGVGAFGVLCSEPNPLLNGGVSCDATLPTAPGQLITLWSGGVVLDSVDTSGWSFSAGQSRELGLSNSTPTLNDVQAAWCDAIDPLPGGSFGSPGAPGSCP